MSWLPVCFSFDFVGFLFAFLSILLAFCCFSLRETPLSSKTFRENANRWKNTFSSRISCASGGWGAQGLGVAHLRREPVCAGAPAVGANCGVPRACHAGRGAACGRQAPRTRSAGGAGGIDAQHCHSAGGGGMWVSPWPQRTQLLCGRGAKGARCGRPRSALGG